LIVDNTNGACGYLIRPFSHGADIIVQSLAPYLSISGSNSSGIILDAGTFPWNLYSTRFPQFTDPLPAFHGKIMWEEFGKLAFLVLARASGLRDTGPCLNPFEAEKLLLGCETLGVRMERICSNARELAGWLEKSGKVDGVVYPGIDPSFSL
jgi:O-acetylhomoserine/O-acetylserine sulfhydrylase